MTTTTVPVRRVPPLGGFNLTFLLLEIRRLLRNRRTVIFTLVLPVVFFLIFGTNSSYANEPAGSGNVEAFIMISMAVYGAMLGTTATGAMVSVERAQGWSRQLRLTPLKPVTYIVIKVLTATLVGLASIAAVYLVGSIAGSHMPASVWVETVLIAWVGSFPFAAFGLFMGYLLPSDNVMQILGPVLALLAFRAIDPPGPYLGCRAEPDRLDDGVCDGCGMAVPSRHRTGMTGNRPVRERAALCFGQAFPATRDFTTTDDAMELAARIRHRV